MGYYASAEGYITFSSELTDMILDDVKKLLDDGYFYFANMDISVINGKHTISLSGYDKYDDDDMLDVLKTIAQTALIDEGEIEASGDDNAHWRFIWRRGEWIEQNGYIVYEEDSKFGEISWSEDDIRKYLDEHPEFPEDGEFFYKVLDECMNDHHFTDRMIEVGWQEIADRAYKVLVNNKNK